jgi:hypothetical protein
MSIVAIGVLWIAFIKASMAPPDQENVNQPDARRHVICG